MIKKHLVFGLLFLLACCLKTVYAQAQFQQVTLPELQGIQDGATSLISIRGHLFLRNYYRMYQLDSAINSWQDRTHTIPNFYAASEMPNGKVLLYSTEGNKRHPTSCNLGKPPLGSRLFR
jgi:hypothetical protein